MSQLKNKSDLHHGPALELRFAGESKAGTISGYGSVFGVKDSYADVIEPGAFGASLARHKQAGTMPAMLWQHDPTQPIGRWEEAREDNRGLFLRGELNLATAKGQEAYALVKQGALDGLSIGYSVSQSKAGKDGLRLLTEIDLWEISIVTFPSNHGARLTGVKAAGEALQLRDRGHLEDLLRDAGLSRGAARAVAAGGWPELTKSADQSQVASNLLQKLNSINTKLRTLTNV